MIEVKKAIEIRLQDIAVRMSDNGVSNEEIKTQTGVSEEQVIIRKNQIEQEAYKKSSNFSDQPFRQMNQDPVVNEIRTNVVTILDMLKQLNDKLKEIKN